MQPARQRQAGPLGWAEIKEFLETAGKGIRADRERALLCVAYDTIARRSELVALDVDDLTFAADGTGAALIRRSKTTQAGEGSQAYLSRETVRHLQHWVRAARITEGPVFRRLVGRSGIGPRLRVDIVADIFKRVARWFKLPEGEVGGNQWALDQGWGHTRSPGPEYRSRLRHAGGTMEIYSHANAIW